MRLTLDDVQDVLDYMRAKGRSPVLSAGFAIASDAASLKSATKSEIRNVTIGTDTVAVILYRSHAVVRYATGIDDAREIAESVVRLLKPRRRWAPLVWLRLVAIVTVGSLVFLGGGFALLGMLNGNPLFERVDLIAILAAVCLLLGLGYASLIVADNRRAGQAVLSPTFRDERREVTVSLTRALIVGAVTAVISGAAGALITWVLTGS